MKVIRLGLAVLFIVGRTQAAEEFEIKDYSPDTGNVEIKCETGTTNRPFSSFGTNEQQKITGWLVDKEFQSRDLMIDIERKEDRTTSRDGERADVSYTITLKNQTRIEFDAVQVEYRIFYATQSGETKSKNSKSGTQFYKKLLPGEAAGFETAPIWIRNEKIIKPGIWSSSMGDYVGARSTVYVKDRLIGIYVCVSKLGSDGKTIKQEKENGSLPEKELWAEYPPPEEKTIKPGRPSDVRNLSESEVRAYTSKADGGDDESAYLLCVYYSSQGNKEKTKKWVSKARELLKNPTPQESQRVKQRLAVLDRIEAGTH